MAKVDNENEMHSDEISRKCFEHEEKMLEARFRSKEDQQAAEMKHQMAVGWILKDTVFFEVFFCSYPKPFSDQ